MRNRIVMIFFTLSLAFSVLGRMIAGKENEDKEYEVHFLHYTEWNC